MTMISLLSNKMDISDYLVISCVGLLLLSMFIGGIIVQCSDCHPRERSCCHPSGVFICRMLCCRIPRILPPNLLDDNIDIIED